MTVGDTSGLGWQRLLLVQAVAARPAIDKIERLSRWPGGSATVRSWGAEDDALVCYTTAAVVGGPLHGKFFVQVFEVLPPSDRITVYERTFSKRATAKARALQIYADHSPKWARRNGY